MIYVDIYNLTHKNPIASAGFEPCPPGESWGWVKGVIVDVFGVEADSIDCDDEDYITSNGERIALIHMRVSDVH